MLIIYTTILKLVLYLEFEKLPTIVFYPDTMQKAPARTVTVMKDKEGGFAIKNEKQVLNWFQPEGVWLEYGIFVMRVDAIIGKWYSVYINNNKAVTMWTKAEPVKKFVRWQTFLVKETTAIDKIQGFELDIKVAPDDKARTSCRLQDAGCRLITF